MLVNIKEMGGKICTLGKGRTIRVLELLGRGEKPTPGQHRQGQSWASVTHSIPGCLYCQDLFLAFLYAVALFSPLANLCVTTAWVNMLCLPQEPGGSLDSVRSGCPALLTQVLFGRRGRMKLLFHDLSLGSVRIYIISGHTIRCWNDRMLVTEC